MDKKTRKPWIDRLNDNIEDAFFEAFNEQDSPRSVLASVEMGDGSFIETELHSDNTIDVYIYHADEENNVRECPNIVTYIEDNLVSWEELKQKYDDADIVMDVWQQHGFRNEADYWHYRFGS